MEEEKGRTRRETKDGIWKAIAVRRSNEVRVRRVLAWICSFATFL
jgi:uncharacterized protein YjcR